MSFLLRTGYRLSKTRLRPPLIWLRHRGLDPADVMIASYPRSGNTWFRFLLAEIMTGHTSGFDDINTTVPQVGQHHIARPLLPGGGRLIKTHEPYRKEYAKAIYLVRDVRDAVLSYYDRGTYLGVFKGITFDVFLPMFLQGETNPIGSWQSHVHTWLESPLARSGQLLVVRFEDMRRDTEATLARVLAFLGVAADEPRIRHAIAANSVERMRAKEDASRTYPHSSQESGRFVRGALVGGWRSRLTDEQIEVVDRYAGPELERLGYSTLAAKGQQSLSLPGKELAWRE
ncbi:MAG: sulfotransferase domain-containing protein [Acidobacteriia bacterium]|nr:sulfotransferase domain-containing protein [Terriglobia bacterium]